MVYLRRKPHREHRESEEEEETEGRERRTETEKKTQGGKLWVRQLERGVKGGKVTGWGECKRGGPASMFLFEDHILKQMFV